MIDDGGYNVALDNAPMYAAQVGILLSSFALVEGYVPQLVSRLTGATQDDAFVFVGSFMSFAARIDLLGSLTKTRKSSTNETKAVDFFVPKLRSVNSIRNRYAHGIYGYMTAEKFQIQSYSNDAIRKAQVGIYTIDDVKADTFTIKQLIQELHAYLYRNEQPGP